MKSIFLKNKIVVIRDDNYLLYANLKSGRAFLVCNSWNLDSLKAVKHKSYLNSKQFNPLYTLGKSLRVKTIEEARALFIISSNISDGAFVNKSFEAFQKKDFFELMRLEREYLGEQNV